MQKTEEHLVTLILASGMEEVEKEFWLSALPLMNAQENEELTQTLEAEVSQLANTYV